MALPNRSSSFANSKSQSDVSFVIEDDDAEEADSASAVEKAPKLTKKGRIQETRNKVGYTATRCALVGAARRVGACSIIHYLL